MIVGWFARLVGKGILLRRLSILCCLGYVDLGLLGKRVGFVWLLGRDLDREWVWHQRALSDPRRLACFMASRTTLTLGRRRCSCRARRTVSCDLLGFSF